MKEALLERDTDFRAVNCWGDLLAVSGFLSVFLHFCSEAENSWCWFSHFRCRQSSTYSLFYFPLHGMQNTLTHCKYTNTTLNKTPAERQRTEPEYTQQLWARSLIWLKMYKKLLSGNESPTKNINHVCPHRDVCASASASYLLMIKDIWFHQAWVQVVNPFARP